MLKSPRRVGGRYELRALVAPPWLFASSPRFPRVNTIWSWRVDDGVGQAEEGRSG
jgi:hypothetical protein